MGDLLFDHVLELHGGLPWDTVLDAGTGAHSLGWVRTLPTRRWAAVTGDPGMARTLEEGPARGRRPQDALVVGNWTDPALLQGERFDVVLADYLLGALDGFAPYFQDRLFPRLKPHVRGRLYVIGLEPLTDAPETEAERLVTEVARARDATLLLARERCYREYPATWVRRHLEGAGFRIVSERKFGNVLGSRWVENQVAMCLRRLDRLPHHALVTPWRTWLEDLRGRALAHCAEHGGLRCGSDHVLAAEPLP